MYSPDMSFSQRIIGSYEHAFRNIDVELQSLNIPGGQRAMILADVRAKAMRQLPTVGPSRENTIAALARNVHRTRLKGNGLLGVRIMSDPKFEMLLLLFIAEYEDRRLSVSDLCLSVNVPQTTGLRHLEKLEADGFLCRYPDVRDGRRWWVQATDRTREGVTAYMTELGRDL